MDTGAIYNPVQVGSRIVNNPTTVVLIGDWRTGKSSLIKRGEKGKKFSTGPIEHILPNSLLADGAGLYKEDIVALDNSPSNQSDMEKKLHEADVVILTYSCEDPQTFLSLEKTWIPKLEKEKLRSTVKVIAVGCMVELKSKSGKFWEDFEIVCEDMLLKYPILEAFVECSAHQDRNIQVVFRFAMRLFSTL